MTTWLLGSLANLLIGITFLWVAIWALGRFPRQDTRHSSITLLQWSSMLLIAGVLYIGAIHIYQDSPYHTPFSPPRTLMRPMGSSFPSHHALIVCWVAATVAFVDLRASIPLWCLAALEACLLVAMHYHTVLDVVGALAIVALSMAGTALVTALVTTSRSPVVVPRRTEF